MYLAGEVVFCGRSTAVAIVGVAHAVAVAIVGGLNRERLDPWIHIVAVNVAEEALCA